MSTNRLAATLDEVISRRANKIGWVFAASMPFFAILLALAGLVPITIGLPVSVILLLLVGRLVKRTIAAGLRLGVAMSVYGRVVLGVATVALIMVSSAQGQPQAGSFIVPIILSLLVLDRLCGFVGRVEIVEFAAEQAVADEADREFDLLRPENLSTDTPTGKRDTVTVSPPASAGRVVIPNTPVTPAESFSQWETEPPPAPAVG